jgi:serine protease
MKNAACFFAAALLLATPVYATRAALPAVDGEVIVAFKPGASTTRKHVLAARGFSDNGTEARKTLADRAATLGARWGHSLQAGMAVGPDAQVMRLPGMDAAALARQLSADPDVLYAVPNGRKRATVAPNDTLYPQVATGARPSGPASGQWYLRAPDNVVTSAINVEAAWARTRGNANVVVAVLDTGVRFEHPDLGRVATGGRLLPGYDMVSDSAVGNDGDGRDSDASDPGDWTTAAENSDRNSKFYKCDPSGSGQAVASSSSWHGTATASLIGAATDNSLGMAGTAPNVRVLPVRVLGKCFGNDSDIVAGMRWAAGISVPGLPDNPTPARVLNMSLGGEGACTATYQQAVNEIVAKGVVIVAAAGNSAGGPVSTPANCNGVIGVLALRHVGTKVGFSDLGSEIAIAAPGGNCVNTAAGSACLYPILAATNSGSQGPAASVWSDSFNITVGTSFSSPLVAGVVGLMVSLAPSLEPARVRQVLQSTARPFPTTGGDNGPGQPVVTACRAPSAGVEQLQCYCNTAYCGAGMLDARAAIAAVDVGLRSNAQVDVIGTPTPGAALSLSGASSVAATGTTIRNYDWTLIDGGGIVPGFTGATNTPTVTVTPNAAGSFTVRLTLTDSAGTLVSSNSTVVVAASTPVTPPVTPPTDSGGGGGGGAFSWAWVLGIALAAGLLRSRSRPI